VQFAYFVIIGGFALAQERVGPILDSVFDSIRAHLRPTAIGLFAGFGIIFVVKGLSSLNSSGDPRPGRIS